MAAPSFTPGQFVWRELFTTDIEAARAFYSAVCEWSIETRSMGGMDYHLILSASTQVGGIMPLDLIPEERRYSHWLGYVSIPDVDEAVASARSAGGRVVMEPRDTPPVGRMSVIRDPHGAVLALWRGHRGDATALPGRHMAVGTFCWEQLRTVDIPCAVQFYKKVFGWDCVRYEPLRGRAHAFRSLQGDVATLLETDTDTPPHWISFIVVQSLSAARQRTVDNKGKVLVNEVGIKGAGRYAVIEDPTGAVVALYENTRS